MTVKKPIDKRYEAVLNLVSNYFPYKDNLKKLLFTLKQIMWFPSMTAQKNLVTAAYTNLCELFTTVSKI